jgi:hypothetical protein
MCDCDQCFLARTDGELEDIMRVGKSWRDETRNGVDIITYIQAKVEMELRSLGKVLGFKRINGSWVKDD